MLTKKATLSTFSPETKAYMQLLSRHVVSTCVHPLEWARNAVQCWRHQLRGLMPNFSNKTYDNHKRGASYARHTVLLDALKNNSTYNAVLDYYTQHVEPTSQSFERRFVNDLVWNLRRNFITVIEKNVHNGLVIEDNRKIVSHYDRNLEGVEASKEELQSKAREVDADMNLLRRFPCCKCGKLCTTRREARFHSC